MISHNLSIYVLLILVFGCSPKITERKSDLDRLRLKGSVKSYIKTISEFSLKSEDSLETKPREVLRGFLVFNREGDIVEDNRYTRKGKLYKTLVSIYEYRSNEVKEIVIESPNDTVATRIKKYDSNGNEVEYLSYKKDSIIYHSKSLYNSNSKLIEHIPLKDGETEFQHRRTKYFYDTSGNRIKRIQYYEGGSKSEWISRYDDRGNEIEWFVYGTDGKLERRDVYVYDENSNLTEERLYNKYNVLETRGVSKYDKNGNETEYVEYLYDAVRSKDIYHYPEDGVIIMESYNSKGELKSTYKTVSEFDAEGNLVKESNYENGKLKSVKAYKIEYFK